ncbi:MAG: DUF2520 domain-containing protein [Actinobacteria bacterium]|nr:DUF2520 domain-containing protein [Actinomycetota bacterium]
MDVAVLGAGRTGTALAVLLARAGHRVVAISGREATAERGARYLSLSPTPPARAAAAGELVLVATPDGAVAEVCAEAAAGGGFRPGQWVAHLSGTVRLEALDPARAAGAGVLALHPLQTFPDVEQALARIPGSAMAVTAAGEEGFAFGEGLARAIGVRPFRLADEAKPLYHAAAVFASNYVIASLALAEELFERAGIDDPVDLFAPLVRACVENVVASGPEDALTGPVARGDAATVEGHLRALADADPRAVLPYLALARVALDVAGRSGRLDGPGRAAVEEVLDRWT